MTRPDVDSACQYALRRLRGELAPDLYYHSLAHTQDDVVPAARRLGRAARVLASDLVLLRTAAWYHDLGFVEQRADHEAVGAAIAAAVLPGFGYSAEQIAAICGMIMATRLPQQPRTLLEKILADADLDSLGRADFMPTSLNLRAELAAAGTDLSMPQWYQRQLEFLQSHRYFTTPARQLRDAQKQQNIAMLQALIDAAH